jgi:hypothetical protein
MSGRHSEKETLQVVGAAAFSVGLVGLAVFGLGFGTAETRVPTVLGVAVAALVLVWVFVGRAS